MEPIEVKKFLKKIDKLPTLPAVAMQVIAVANDPNSAAEDLSKLISSDQALSAKVLKMVNSAYYGMKQRISSVKQAIVILGFNTIRSLAISTAVMDKFATSGKDVFGFSRAEFWKHSIATAMTSRLIGMKMGLPEDMREEYFIAGLLHDLGKIILDQYFHEDFKRVVVEIVTTGRSFYQAEMMTIGVNHAEIGGELASEWGMPSPLIKAIRWHHEPENQEEQYQKIVSGVHLANLLVKTKGMGNGGDMNITGLSERAVEALGLPEGAVNDLLSKDMDAEWTKAKEFLQLLNKSA